MIRASAFVAALTTVAFAISGPAMAQDLLVRPDRSFGLFPIVRGSDQFFAEDVCEVVSAKRFGLHGPVSSAIVEWRMAGEGPRRDTLSLLGTNELQFDKEGMLTQVAFKQADGAVLSTYRYTTEYRLIANRRLPSSVMKATVREGDANPQLETTSYEYDREGRLLIERRQSDVVTEVSRQCVTTTIQRGDDGRVISVTIGDLRGQATILRYDAEGRLESVETGGERSSVHRVKWDGQARASFLDEPAHTSLRFVEFDARGSLAAWRVVPPQQVDASRPIRETDASASVERDAHGNCTLVRTRLRGLDYDGIPADFVGWEIKQSLEYRSVDGGDKSSK